MGALLGYARVSTADQDLRLQIEAFKKEGVTKIFKEKVSGAKADRPELHKMLEYAREGDTIIVWKLDRLARSLRQLIEIVDDLNQRGIGFKVLTGAPIDTTSPHGKLVFGIFGALAEFEREQTLERVEAGLAAAREAGRVGGRPSLSEDKVTEIRQRLARKESWSTICQAMSISRSTLAKYAKADAAAA